MVPPLCERSDQQTSLAPGAPRWAEPPEPCTGVQIAVGQGEHGITFAFDIHRMPCESAKHVRTIRFAIFKHTHDLAGFCLKASGVASESASYCLHSPPAPRNVGIPDAALRPAPARAVMCFELRTSSLKADMSLRSVCSMAKSAL